MLSSQFENGGLKIFEEKISTVKTVLYTESMYPYDQTEN